MKIGCLFVNITDDYYPNNYLKDNETFFIPNAINSFKKWNPEIEVHYVHNNNLPEYCKELNIEELHNHVGLIRLSLMSALVKKYQYDKIITLGIDTITCAKLDEFINDNENDAIYTLGVSHPVQTRYWSSPAEQFYENGQNIVDIANINGDISCYNNYETIDELINIVLEYWDEQVDQGGMNYLYINQNKYNKKIKIVDYPYHKSDVVYNIRSKGVIGGYCLVKGKVLNGRKGQVISDRYPMLDFYVKDNKLFTKDNKHIKVFHICEGLSYRTEEDELSYDESVNEIKTMWFNAETIEFFKNQCKCNF